ncbi:MAG TPA: sugar ABC transporter ATP-binding protein [Planctomycetaceae bacterium]|nr:sugar ABC transporter ATP-binding protein [Planctomycetaceae bacterium]
MTAAAQATSAPLLDCRGIGVQFGGVAALEDVHFDLRPGEIHGLVGCNGAGKSTLMKVLAGNVAVDAGEIKLNGETIRLTSPRQALDRGIAMVYQELSGIGQLSVAENLFLGRQPLTSWGTVDWRAMVRQARASLKELDIEIDVRRRLDAYPLVIRQMVEIARGLHSGARILILDEPTSALSLPEARRLFELMWTLKSRGIALVFISHFLEDVLAVCDRVTVLRDGRHVATHSVKQVTRSQLIEQMVGGLSKAAGQEAVEATLPAESKQPVRLRIDRFTRAGLFDDVTFKVRSGECLGLYGFVGAGHQELVQAIGGAIGIDAGETRVDNRPVRIRRVSDAVRQGVVLVAADRGRTVNRRATIAHNVTLSHLRSAVGEWLIRRREAAICRPLLKRVGCRPPDPWKRAGLLSGGNQQKIVLAKWLMGSIRVLLLEEPTRGMDVHAKAEVMQLVREQQASGAAVVLASTEPEFLLAYCDRILTLSRGKVTREFAAGTVTKQALMHAAELEL